MSDSNYSINSLIGTFATVSTGTSQPIPNSIICVDTCNNRIGVNTIDPSYSIHVIDNHLNNNADGTISSSHLIVGNNTSPTKIIFNNLPTSDVGLDIGQLYNDSGTLKIKL